MTQTPPPSQIDSRSHHLDGIRRWPLAVAAIGTLGLVLWSLQANESGAPLDRRCEAWDRAASAALSDLIADRSPIADQRLGDAVFRLRRARKYCRHDLAGLARFDYEALTDGRYHRTQ
jgi:hypothetical protein